MPQWVSKSDHGGGVPDRGAAPMQLEGIDAASSAQAATSAHAHAAIENVEFLEADDDDSEPTMLAGAAPAATTEFGAAEFAADGAFSGGASHAKPSDGPSTLSPVAAPSPAALTASDREAVLSLLGIGSPAKQDDSSPGGRELFPKGDGGGGASRDPGQGRDGRGSRAAGAGSNRSSPKKRAAGASPAASPRPVKLPKTASVSPKKKPSATPGARARRKAGTPKTNAAASTTKAPKTPKVAAKKAPKTPTTPQSGKKTPRRPAGSTPRRGKRGAAVVTISNQMLDISIQLGKLVRNPLALKWCTYEHFYSSIDRYDAAPPCNPLPNVARLHHPRAEAAGGVHR